MLLSAILVFVFASQSPDSAYIERGHRVEDAYRHYLSELNLFRSTIIEELQKASMDVEKQLEDKPSAVPYGYQILPRIVPDAPRPEKRLPPAPVSYSWIRTEKMIEVGESKIMSAAELGIRDRISRYGELAVYQKLIDQHIQYNWLWQKAINEDKAGYERNTARFNAIVEGKPDPGQHKPVPPTFIEVIQAQKNSTVIRVPMYTDITNTDFLSQAKEAIEEAWQYSDGEKYFRVQVEFKQITADQLYSPQPPPAPGTHIDLQQHTARIPDGAGILTTGANSTHVNGRYIVLGPADIRKNTLAHELGQILGFADEYVRGYRDLGRDGYEVLEILPGPRRHHVCFRMGTRPAAPFRCAYRTSMKHLFTESGVACALVLAVVIANDIALTSELYRSKHQLECKLYLARIPGCSGDLTGSCQGGL